MSPIEDRTTLTVVGSESFTPRLAFLGYARAILNSVLREVRLLSKQRCLEPDHFVLRDSSAPNGPLPLSADTVNPAVDLLATHLEALLQVTVPECKAAMPAQIPAFRVIVNGHASGDQKGHPAPLYSGAWEWSAADLQGKGQWRLEVEEDSDYVFSYPISVAPAPHSRIAYCRDLLAILLDVVDLVQDSEVIFPDLVLRNDETLPLFPNVPGIPPQLGPRSGGLEGTGARQPLHSVAATEPIIVALARHWGLLAAGLNINGGSNGPTIDGFRLRRTADWVVDGTGHPSEVYEYLARVCNVSCKFCYLYGNPGSLAVARGTSVISERELNTRLRYFSSENRRSLFQAQWEINEFLVDPKIYALLPALRQGTNEPFYFITNGSPLKPKLVKLLAEVKPVHLIVSINSIDEERRSEVMREHSSLTSTAISSLRLLVEHEIPFGISVVAFPQFPLHDLERTIRAAASLPATFVRVNLPGFTRELPYEHDFDTDEYWATVVNWVRKLRLDVSIPILTIPSAFEQNIIGRDPLEPRVLGVIRGSPASTSGLRPNDLVTEMNGFYIRTRVELNSLLLLSRGRVRLTVQSGTGSRVCEFDASSPDRFPYAGHVTCKYVFPCGVVMAPSLSPRNADEIRRIAAQLQARHIWVITSKLMRPAGEALIDRYAPELRKQIQFVIATNEYLGGNIRLMDMCTVGDIARAVEREAQSSALPDVVLLSESGFNEHGRDLQGQHWKDLERFLGIRVRLLSVPRFAF
ncbi:MAG: radical SAM protein [Silvibacterium sp.]